MEFRKKTTAILIAILMISMMTIAVNADTTVVLIDDGFGTAMYATKPTVPAETSVELSTGAVVEDGVDAGRIELLISTPISISDFVIDPTFMLYETTITLDTTYGGEWDMGSGPPQDKVPWGIPYVNILLDLDGDGDVDDKLEGVGSSAGGATVDDVAVPHTEESWTEMQEAWGYYDSEDSIIGGDFSGFFVVHTLAEWITAIEVKHPDAEVVGVQITYGYWKEVYGELGPVYVDDITVGFYTYDLEQTGVTITTDVVPMEVSIDIAPMTVDFGPVIYGQDSGIETITVTNNGDVEVTITADIDTQFYQEHLLMGTVTPPTSVYADGWTLDTIDYVGTTSAMYYLQLVAVDDLGSHSGTLVFEATPVYTP